MFTSTLRERLRPNTSVYGIGAVPRVPTPMVYTFTPSNSAASAAVIGATVPELFWPSVIRMMMRLSESRSRNRFSPALIAEPIAVPSSMASLPASSRSRLASRKVVIERQRRGDISPTGESDEADSVRRPIVDESLEHRLGHGDAVGPFPLQLKILGQHAAGQIERHSNVDAAGLEFLGALTPLRSGHRQARTAEAPSTEGTLAAPPTWAWPSP